MLMDALQGFLLGIAVVWLASFGVFAWLWWRAPLMQPRDEAHELENI
jgi:hypothetical protein